MTRTKVALEFFLPTGSFARINDAIEETRAVLEKHKGTNFFITYSGPFPDNAEAKSNDRQQQARDDVGRARGEAGQRVRDDFEDHTDAQPAEPAEPVKRGRGRPRKSDAEPAGNGTAEAPRAPAGGSDEGQRGTGRRSREGDRGDESRGADEGAGKGRGEGEGRARGAGADRGAERRDTESARVAKTVKDRATAPDADEWDDAPADDGPDANVEEGPDWWAKTPGDDNWPDHLMPDSTDKDALKDALTDHFEQSGDRAKTLAVLKDATGESTVPNVHPDDYDKAIRFLLKDAARIKFGVKR